MDLMTIGQIVNARKLLVSELNMKPEDVAYLTDYAVKEILSKEFYAFFEMDDDGGCNTDDIMLIKKSDYKNIKKYWINR